MLVGRSGVGMFNITDLQKQLAGKVVSVNAFVSEFSEGMRGSASPEDLETMFQLVHLYATESRVDSSALNDVPEPDESVSSEQVVHAARGV